MEKNMTASEMCARIAGALRPPLATPLLNRVIRQPLIDKMLKETNTPVKKWLTVDLKD